MTTVLLAEDEEPLRSAIADFLRRRGFAVIETGTAAEAMAVLKTDTAVDLVFSDVNMPGRMDGFELAHWIQEHRLGMPVVLTSGKPKVHQVDGANDQSVRFLPKPYDPTHVEQTIRQLVTDKQS